MKENIVVTDGYTLNPGDLSWRSFESLGSVTYYDRTSEAEIEERCKNASVIVTNKTPVRKAIIESAKALKIIAVTATGYNIVDLDAAHRHGVIVCNVPGYGTDSVAQHTFALILELTNHVGKNAQSVQQGDWSRSPDFCYSRLPLVELSGKVLGIVGYGRIGQKVAEIGMAFGMQVIYHSPSRKFSDPGCASIEEIFSRSDVVSLHCPLTTENAGFVNEGLLTLMKPTAYLINTSRGQLINENDLALVLKQKQIAGAALDVLSQEPPSNTNPLINLANCVITPHNAWLSVEARRRIMETAFDNVSKALNGTPQNVVKA